ncbi:S41 family peptidase [Pseudoalteromonas xiamenensis]|uniref:Tail specific protease domain-containing protein n=1 Tax=Pseudoalteromonas xiamenensis TaxID=882626 RepID=A0A975HMD8_9GAMM|nr:S41 family peptidase [Pseudoalteromonas xiamenensis]QTH72999.1 hypothetical protein J5O05_17220 [Pseudoalteromonas xiamenensis]
MMKLCSLISLVLLTFSSISNALTNDEISFWEGDIAHFEKELMKRHLNLFHTLSKEDFMDEVDKIKRNLPSLSHHEVVIELMKLTRKVSDGHTSVPLWNQEKTLYPLEYNYLEGRFIVSKAPEKYTKLLGTELVSIDKVETTEIYSKFAEIVPFVENSNSERIRVSENVNNATLLNSLHISKNMQFANFIFREPSGGLTSITIDAVSEDELQSIEWHELSVLHPSRFFEELDSVHSRRGLWAGFNKESKTAYIRIDDYPDLNNSIETFESIKTQLIAKGAKNLVIDLRNSYGGDLYVGLLWASILSSIDTIDWLKGSYTLISNKTFSAAMSNATQFKRLLNSTLVGQPTGARPNGFQDLGHFTLPNSKLVVTYSKRYYRFSDFDEKFVSPDIEIVVSIEDLRSNRDSTLQYLMRKFKEKNENQ